MTELKTLNDLKLACTCKSKCTCKEPTVERIQYELGVKYIKRLENDIHIDIKYVGWSHELIEDMKLKIITAKAQIEILKHVFNLTEKDLK